MKYKIMELEPNVVMEALINYIAERKPKYNIQPLYKTSETALYNADCTEVMARFPDNYVDIIFADPPYNLSKDGITCHAGKMVSGTNHCIYQCGFLLQKFRFHILNDISWFKPNAAPNLACTTFAHSHETLLWAKNKEAKNTVIRQLFYPYRQWQQYTEKQVKTLFFEKRGKYYSLWQFEFQNPNGYILQRANKWK